MQNNMTPIPRMRTIKEAYGWLKEQDPSTGLSCNAFRKLVVQGKIPSLHVGNRRLLSVEKTLLFSFGMFDMPAGNGVVLAAEEIHGTLYDALGDALTLHQNHGFPS